MDETALIRAAQRGNLDAFNELVLTYQHRIYNLAYRILGDPAAAEDATQETFIAAYRKIGSFRGGSFVSWLLRIVANRCYDELRRQKRRPTTSWEAFGEIDEEANPALINGGESPEERAERAELARFLQAAISTLPPDQRVVLVLSDVEGLSYAEIAETVRVPVGTVKSRLARARARLRDLLQERGELLPRAYRLENED
ncbi:MAG TPA: sigma-70 family RNA polymerase sigma factor [Thermoflexia bacterium]|jgi:RNA polymerase sigma-70 factor (ECF subfamily)|nr:sigma-70 family RNA polymerase sigma factor [Thermoflexia bacterium]